MKVSDQVSFLEEEIEAYREIYRKEIERELSGTGIYLQNLTHYDFTSSDLKDYFYSMGISKGGRKIGLILPFRGLIFHSLHDANRLGSKDEKRIEVLAGLAERRGYHLEYNAFAWQEEPIIEGILEGRLPASLLK
jgi:hypothetical protein